MEPHDNVEESDAIAAKLDESSAVAEYFASDPIGRAIDARLRVLEAIAEKWHGSEAAEHRAKIGPGYGSR